MSITEQECKHGNLSHSAATPGPQSGVMPPLPPDVVPPSPSSQRKSNPSSTPEQSVTESQRDCCCAVF